MRWHNALYWIVFSSAMGGCSGLPFYSTPAPAPTPPPQPDAAAVRPAPAPARAEALIQAISALGTDYRYGGASHATGFDCSGLVAHVYRAAWGVTLPRTARAQADVGTPIAQSALAPGDLVFYNTLGRPYSHVGIYLGGDKFIHAPKTGAQVRIESLRGAYWTRRFDGARRILPPEAAPTARND